MSGAVIFILFSGVSGGGLELTGGLSWSIYAGFNLSTDTVSVFPFAIILYTLSFLSSTLCGPE